eukprot:TRINITY_DN49799_c0_g1_i1.p1 TRINITY_DN49799_c0_g1~~TRINITY_DN49799_c0_g1_i1.p1  ORF type:complete len:325 (+),score=73.76 TRINITY_DN49799_c0_g1_i1:33-977(+)
MGRRLLALLQLLRVCGSGSASTSVQLSFLHEAALQGAHCREPLESSASAASPAGGLKILRREVSRNLRACGFAWVRNAFDADEAKSMRASFLAFEKTSAAKDYEHERLRADRMQYCLPFEKPFNESRFFASTALVDILSDYLGEEFVLDLLTMVVVPPGAAEQAMHRDVRGVGSIAIQIPLHATGPSLAPLALCGGTHNLSAGDWTSIRSNALQSNTGDARKALQRAVCRDYVLAAPVDAGDVVIYDSNLYHWGSANSEDSTRYAIYVNYKNSSQHQGVHASFDAPPIQKEATGRFRAAFTAQRLQGRKHAEEL